jgi:hypothetical protein
MRQTELLSKETKICYDHVIALKVYRTQTLFEEWQLPYISDPNGNNEASPMCPRGTALSLPYTSIQIYPMMQWWLQYSRAVAHKFNQLRLNPPTSSQTLKPIPNHVSA